MAISDMARMVFLAVAKLLHPVVPEPSSCGRGAAVDSELGAIKVHR